jgi:hypothetical protein
VAALGIAALLLPVVGAVTRWIGLGLGGFPLALATVLPLGQLSQVGLSVSMPALVFAATAWWYRRLPDVLNGMEEHQAAADVVYVKVDEFQGSVGEAISALRAQLTELEALEARIDAISVSDAESVGGAEWNDLIARRTALSEEIQARLTGTEERVASGQTAIHQMFDELEVVSRRIEAAFPSVIRAIPAPIVTFVGTVRPPRLLKRLMRGVLVVLAVIVVVFVSSGPAIVATVVIGYAASKRLEKRVYQRNPITVGYVVPLMVVVLVLNALVYGASPTLVRPSTFTVSSSGIVPSGMYAELARGDGFVYLVSCDNKSAITAVNLSTVLGAEIHTSRPTALTPSLWSVVTEGKPLSLGYSADC